MRAESALSKCPLFLKTVQEWTSILYPIEIKKSARVSLDMASSFSVLSKINGKETGHGCIICQCDKKLEFSDNVTALPVESV